MICGSNKQTFLGPRRTQARLFGLLSPQEKNDRARMESSAVTIASWYPRDLSFCPTSSFLSGQIYAHCCSVSFFKKSNPCYSGRAQAGTRACSHLDTLCPGALTSVHLAPSVPMAGHCHASPTLPNSRGFSGCTSYKPTLCCSTFLSVTQLMGPVKEDPHTNLV